MSGLLARLIAAERAGRVATGSVRLSAATSALLTDRNHPIQPGREHLLW